MMSQERHRSRILLLEDNSADATLSLRELTRAGFEIDSEIVTTSKEFIERLHSQQYDLILADYRLPDWTGLEALRWLRSSGLDTPFILVTGTLGDDLAVECIKEGATDYVLKDKLDRLPRACRRALEEKQLRLERDRVEKELRQSEEQYRLLFDTNPLPMWVFDGETLAFLAVNEAAVRHYGFSRQDFFAMTIKDIAAEEDIPTLPNSTLRPSEGLSSEICRHRKKDGNTIDVEITSHPLLFRGRQAELVLAQDITEQKKNQERLRQSEERFAKAFRSSPIAITISSTLDSRYVDVNDAFLHMTGYGREEVIGRTADELRVWLESAERVALIQQLAKSGMVTAFPAKFKTRSGDIRLTEVSAELIELDRVPCVLAITRDCTEAKRLEEQFRQAQKMEAIGRLAGGIAHDFNNMLSVIIGYSELLQEGFETGPARRGIDQIKTAAERAASLTRRLLAFSRQQVLSLRILNLNAVVENLSKMLRHMIGEDIELVFTLGSSLGNVRADLVQVEQIIMNLAVNARDAMPQGGKLIIETCNADLDATFASSHPSVRLGSYVLLAVSDTGCGMDESTMLRIFERFFTTKGPGKGTGLGLSMVHGVVNQSGGSIWVYSKPGKGTTFKIYLPRVDEAPTVEPSKAAVTTARGSETILVVEDEEALRVLVAGFLQSSGYTVLQASEGQEGIKRAKEHGDVDLLMTDVVMPGMSGSELASAIRPFFPHLKLLYMSGYTSDLIAQHGVLETDATLLEKPFTKESLLTKVRMVLESR